MRAPPSARSADWDDEDALVATILEDDPAATLDALMNAVRNGASAEQMGAAVAYAAFLRMARFHTSNEFGDWDTVHNTLTAAKRAAPSAHPRPVVELLRAAFDTAISVYLDRFLNMPAQRIPEPNGAPPSGDNGDGGDNAMGQRILNAMNSQQQVERSARLVTDYAALADNPDSALSVLAHAMLREDSTFHHFQIVDAAIKQYQLRRGSAARSPFPSRHGAIPSRPLPHAARRQSDVQHSRPPQPRRRHLQRRVGRNRATMRAGLDAKQSQETNHALDEGR